MDKNKATELLSKYQSGQQLTDEETAILESWYLDWRVDDKLDLSESEISADLQQIRAGIPHLDKKGKTVKLWPRIAAAAAAVIIFSFGMYIYKQKENKQQQFAQNSLNDVAPGGNKATITLASGKQIILTDAKNGLLTKQGKTAISIQDHDVVYNATGTEKKLEYNTLTTPRGGQYQLDLADGTKVWLDAASSITFPVAFVGKDREVKITGQVYFEVAHNPAKPFRVTANNQTVEVLGTHFNINSYADEPVIKTTLLEGSIKLTANGNQAILKPGEQAQNGKEFKVVNNADLSETMAWHNGLFEFNKADIPTVMRQLSRWYDVEVGYEGKIPDLTFSGKIYRNVTALKVSDILSYEKIHFRIEGKKIIVTP